VSWNRGFLSESSDEWLNTVVGTYVEPDQKWNSHSTPPVRGSPPTSSPTASRARRSFRFAWSATSQALRIAEIARRLGRLWGRGQVTLGPRFCELEDGDWVQWQSDRYFGGGTKTLRIEAYSIDEKWQNTLTLREINVEVFDDDGEFDLDQSVAMPELPAGRRRHAGRSQLGACGDHARQPGSQHSGAGDHRLGIRRRLCRGDHLRILAGRRRRRSGRRPATYYAAVSYVVGDELGDRLVLGPVTVADYTNPNYQEEDGVTLLLLEDDATVLSLG
jgi:hypothetical protein